MFKINSMARGLAVGAMVLALAPSANANVLVDVGGSNWAGVTSNLSGYSPASTGWYGAGGGNPYSINGMNLNFSANNPFSLDNVQASTSFHANGNLAGFWNWYLSANLLQWTGSAWNFVSALTDAGNPSGAFGNDTANATFNLSAGSPLILAAGDYRIEFNLNTCATSYACSGDFLLNAFGVVSSLNNLDNLRVDGLANVPEPESLALLLGGLGLLGFTARRKKQQAAAW